MIIRKLLFVTLIFSITSCASNYHVISPQYVKYQNEMEENDIQFSYKYDVLKERGNKKYAKKEAIKGVKLAAIRISNNSSEDFTLGKDKFIYNGNQPVTLLEPEFVFKQLKQPVPVYLLYLLLTPLKLTVYKGSSVETTPIGYFIGPGIAILNMGISGSANAKFKEELNASLLNNKTIKAGETVTGLIGIVETGYNPLTLR